MHERVKRATSAPGADIRTTIVPAAQKAVSGFLAAACATNGAESAFALVMKVPSGEIAAMASWPTFDPSMRRNLDKWDGSMAVNRPAQVLFEPGGLVKLLTYAIALDSGVLAEDAKIDQKNGVWEYNGVTIRDDETNTLSIAEAISSRANIAAGKTACLIGSEKFHVALRRFGFGSKTGVAGISGEEVGIIADRAKRWCRLSRHRPLMPSCECSTPRCPRRSRCANATAKPGRQSIRPRTTSPRAQGLSRWTSQNMWS